jgi:hypothetical protein
MKNIQEFESYAAGLNEDNIGTAYTRQGGYNFVPGSEVVLDGTLFRLGVDKIDRESSQFKKAIEALKSIGQATVEIEGGASAVGSDRGYDNDALALRRANNFIKAAREEGVTATMIPKSNVGVSTVANSKEANSEQYVKIKYKDAPRGYTVIGIDNATAVKQGPIKAGDLKPSGDGTEYKIIKVVYSPGQSGNVMKSLQTISGRLNATLYDVSKAYNQKGYSL